MHKAKVKCYLHIIAYNQWTRAINYNILCSYDLALMHFLAPADDVYMKENYNSLQRDHVGLLYSEHKPK